MPRGVAPLLSTVSARKKPVRVPGLWLGGCRWSHLVAYYSVCLKVFPQHQSVNTVGGGGAVYFPPQRKRQQNKRRKVQTCPSSGTRRCHPSRSFDGVPTSLSTHPCTGGARLTLLRRPCLPHNDLRTPPSYDARGVDTWSAGVCLYAMVTGALPFGGGGSLEDTLDTIQTTEPNFPKHLSPLLLVRRRVKLAKAACLLLRRERFARVFGVRGFVDRGV